MIFSKIIFIYIKHSLKRFFKLKTVEWGAPLQPKPNKMLKSKPYDNFSIADAEKICEALCNSNNEEQFFEYEVRKQGKNIINFRRGKNGKNKH